MSELAALWRLIELYRREHPRVEAYLRAVIEHEEQARAAQRDHPNRAARRLAELKLAQRMSP